MLMKMNVIIGGAGGSGGHTMKTDRDFLREGLETYIGSILKNRYTWNSLKINVWLIDVSELKVRFEIRISASKYKYLRSTRRHAIKDIIVKLEQELGIKKKHMVDIEYGQVITYKQKDNHYCDYEYTAPDCEIKYLIPREVYNELETLAKINKDWFDRGTEIHATNIFV